MKSAYGKGSIFTVTLPQKFNKYHKLVPVDKPGEKRVLIYETRHVYSSSIVCSIDKLGVSCTLVTNMLDFCKELETRSYPYVFVASFLLESAKKMIAKLNIATTLVLLYEYGETIAAEDTKMLSLPAHLALISNILNDVEDNANHNESFGTMERFTSPEARVLIVDDINTNLKVMEGLLLPYKIRVDMCKSGAKAIMLVKENIYDMVFMDHMMPEMDGIEATLFIRANEGEYFKKLPIIALTANAVSGIREMFIQNGFSDFLAKPIETLRLNEILNRWIPNDKREKSVLVKQAEEVLPFGEVPPFEIEGVDIKRGLTMTGGKLDRYVSTLEVFCRDGNDKINELTSFLQKNDILGYTIAVHALKSAAATIGAAHLSEYAKTLEVAGNNSNIAFIKDNSDSLTLELRNLLTAIEAALPKEKKEAGDIKYLLSEVMKLTEALNDMDLVIVEEILNNVKNRKWDGYAEDVLEKISHNVLICEYDEALALIDDFIDKVLNEKGNARAAANDDTNIEAEGAYGEIAAAIAVAVLDGNKEEKEKKGEGERHKIKEIKGEKGDFIERIRELDMLMVDHVLSSHGGSAGSYERSVMITLEILPENIEKLCELIGKDLKLYSIEAHSIKGVLRHIGAFELGDMAYELEVKSNDGKRDDCEKLHFIFVEELNNLMKKLAGLF